MKMSLTTKIFVGMAAGLAFGLILNALPAGEFKDVAIVDGLFKLAGDVFIRAIKMLVVPLVFISLVCGASAIGDVKKLGRVGLKIMAYYLATTALAITLALVVSTLVSPGAGLDLSKLVKSQPKIDKTVPVMDTVVNMVPTNPVRSMADENMLQIIVFSILVGVSIALCGEKTRPLVSFFDMANEAMMKAVTIIMLFAPYGVFALIARTFATTGYAAMLPLAKYMFSVFFGLLLQVFAVYFFILYFIARLSPATFMKKFAPVMNVAFSTSSSNATLPVTMEVAEERLGVSKNVASFTLPLGATVNMDGTAILQGVAAVFIAQVYGIPLPLSSYLTIIFTATLASIGTAGVPGVGLITLTMVLQSVGLPIDGIALIIGVDRILDMCRTVVNVTGDAVCTIAVARSENEFDEKIYRAD